MATTGKPRVDASSARRTTQLFGTSLDVGTIDVRAHPDRSRIGKGESGRPAGRVVQVGSPAPLAVPHAGRRPGLRRQDQQASPDLQLDGWTATGSAWTWSAWPCRWAGPDRYVNQAPVRQAREWRPLALADDDEFPNVLPPWALAMASSRASPRQAVVVPLERGPAGQVRRGAIPGSLRQPGRSPLPCLGDDRRS